MLPSSPLCVDIVPNGDINRHLAEPNVLAVIRSDRVSSSVPQGVAYAANSESLDPRAISVGLATDQESLPLEVWRTSTPVTIEQHGLLGIASTPMLTLGRLILSEAAFPDIEIASEVGYRTILDYLRVSPHPYLVRVWNYFPNINRRIGTLDRYQRFCLGRSRAINGTTLWQTPAATAIGTHSPDFVLFFLAAASPGLRVENPRQVAADQYPLRYGPRQPSFARATAKTWGESTHLYISGTASIVGHESKHDHVINQLEEAMRNLYALVTQATQVLMRPLPDTLTYLKVYVRHPEHRQQVRDYLDQTLDAATLRMVLTGDICRSDLLVEVEGIYAERCPANEGWT